MPIERSESGQSEVKQAGLIGGLDMEDDLKDICMNCGKEHEYKLWGAPCGCGNAEVVHQQKCNGCEVIMGQRTDDDYCGPELLYCPECINKAKKV